MRSRSPSRVRRFLAATLFAAPALLALGAGARTAMTSIPLPHSPLLQAIPGAEPGERLVLPGSVGDNEVVHVGIDPAGGTGAVVVDQTLSIQGTGDFFFIVHGPALDARSPADAPVQPGLRKGDVIWAGFSPGKRVLSARVTMDQKRDLSRRLPVAVSVTVTRSGRPVALPARGPLEVVVRITDTAGDYVSVYDAVPGTRPFGDLLDLLDAKLGSGLIPVGGAGGIPGTLGVTGVPVTNPELVLLPVGVDGTVALAGEGVSVGRSAGGTIAGAGLHFTGRLASDADSLVLRVSVPTGSLSAVKLRFGARPIFDDAVSLAPPPGTTWKSWTSAAAPAELRRVLRLVQQVMWRGAEFGKYRAYLGNPSAGRSGTQYLFESSAASAPRSVAFERTRPFGVALAAVAAALIIADATVLWRRS